MKIIYSFKHMATSEALKEHSSERFKEHLWPLLDDSFPIRMTFEVRHNMGHVWVQCHSKDKKMFECKVQAEDIYRASDLAIEKLFRQMTEEKQRRRDARKSPLSREMDLSAAQQELVQKAEKHAIDASSIIRTA